MSQHTFAVYSFVSPKSLTTPPQPTQEAVRLPQGTEEEKGVRERALRVAMERTIQVPLTLLKTIDQTWEPLVQMATVGNYNCRSDLQVRDARM